MNSAILCLDVGGTELKGAAVSPQGALLAPIRHFPANAQASREALLEHLTRTLDALRQGDVTGAALAFPGPFDYENGICLLRGLDKYESLYRVNLRQALSERLALPGDRIRFCNDVGAFALGELGFGQAARAEKAMFLCIGTGCGSAFGVNGALAGSETPGVPPHGYVYDTPFLEGRIDDYISKRGLQALSRELLGQPLEGRELAERAGMGDEAAIGCFAAFGLRLRDAAAPFLRNFHPDCLCLGGQLTKSAPLFTAPLEELCNTLGTRLYVTTDTSHRALQGLTRLFSK